MGLEGAREFLQCRRAICVQHQARAPLDSANQRAFESSLDLLLRIGVEAVERYNDALVAEIVDGLPRTNYELASPVERERRGPFVCVPARNSKTDSGTLRKTACRAGIRQPTRKRAAIFAAHLQHSRRDFAFHEDFV